MCLVEPGTTQGDREHLKQVHQGDQKEEGAEAEKQDREEGEVIRSDRASAQLGSSVITGSDRCFLDKKLCREHTGGQLFP